MRLLFVENRYATRLYEAAAPHLEADGHEVAWLVQNPRFAPRRARVHRLPFPRAAALRSPPADDPMYARLRQADRGLRHFGTGDRHYLHYAQAVGAALDEARPQVVLGEATQLHELIAVELCARRGIPYLFPTATRYPPDRTMVLRGDTMETVGGCGQALAPADAEALIDAVNRRRVRPGYMHAVAEPRLRRLGRIVADRLRITAGWIAGERYATPAPWRKWRLDREHARLRGRWDALAAARARGAPRPCVLYPLQMQPESTIDVWGRPWNDQAEIVRRAARALAPLGIALLVKPNPKPKYETDARLLAAAEAADNVVPLAHGVPMGEVFPAARAVLSVTGTVLIEAVFAGKPALALGHHAMGGWPGITALDTPEAVAGALATPRCEPDAEAAHALLQQLHRTSWPLALPDPFVQPQRLDAAFGRGFAQVCLAAIAAALQPPHGAAAAAGLGR